MGRDIYQVVMQSDEKLPVCTLHHTLPGGQSVVARRYNLVSLLKGRKGMSLNIHIMCNLIALWISPESTCRPGQNADSESMVLYATSPLCIFTVLYCSTGAISQHHRNAELNIDIPSNHPSLLRIALSWHRRHPRHLKTLFHLDRKFSMMVRISQGGRRMFTTHDIPFQGIFIKGVDACSYPCSFRIYPCLSATSFSNFLNNNNNN